MWPWTDRTGRFSPLKSAVLAMALLPALWLAIEVRFDWLGERPVMEAIHQSGLWSVRLLALTFSRHAFAAGLALAPACGRAPDSWGFSSRLCGSSSRSLYR